VTETSTDVRAPEQVGSPPVHVTADFDRAAKRYDLMVALNPGYHRHLRSAARALLEGLPSRLRLLDLGCGSGASTRALLVAADDHGADVDVLALDASAGMLAEAAEKHWPAGVRFVRGLAEELTDRGSEWGIDAGLDGVFAAYLFRNVPVNVPAREANGGRDAVLRAVRGLLRPGGVLVTQEYSVAGSRAARLVWTIICRLVVMPLSRLTRTDVDLYDYLWHSVLRFDSVEQFTDRLWRAGFVDVEVRTVRGWQQGILHTFRATAP
jgi:ubiquinone/menaquinone biosynthesis C-methylase UbiE